MLIDDARNEIIESDGTRRPAPPGLSLTHEVKIKQQAGRNRPCLLELTPRRAPLFRPGERERLVTGMNRPNNGSD